MLTVTPPDHVVCAEPAPSSGLREQLRMSTAAAHRSLDARAGSFELTSLAGYRRFLEASAAALLPLETGLESSGIARLFADWPQRSRTAAITADLGDIGGAVNPLPAMAPMSHLDMLGTMYVLEGSRLGARYLLRTVAGSDEPQIVTATRYLRHGQGVPLWRTFLERLEREPMTAVGELETVAAAQRAFAMFATAMGA
jgi:heme oxygenase (biliverdin-IX-beta and delta-forming)